MDKVKMNDVPFGDCYQVIYYLQSDNEPHAYETFNPQMDEKGNYYELTFKGIIEEIETKENKKVSHFIMIAESGLDGVVYRYNNYLQNEIIEVGTTRGYA